MNYFPQRIFSKKYNKIDRRRFLVATAATLLTGCTAPTSISKVAKSIQLVPPTISNIVNAAGLLIMGTPDAPFTPEYIENLPYATLTAKIGRGQRSLLVLARYDGLNLLWASANESALVTRNGRLIKTAGLERNLLDTQGISEDPIVSGRSNFEGKFLRTVDLDTGRYGIPIESNFDIQGQATIQILNKEHNTLVIREKNRAQSLHWNFTNTFWLDINTSFVWKSIQHFDPSTPPVEIQITKPAAPSPA